MLAFPILKDFFWRVRSALGFFVSSGFGFRRSRNFLMCQVVREVTEGATAPSVEFLRRELRSNGQVISTEDYGAGPRMRLPSTGKILRRSIAQITIRTACPPRQGIALRGLAKGASAKRILELGTSVGIGACYLADSGEDVHLWTIEGAASLHQLAERNFDRMGNAYKITAVNGTFEDCLPSVLKEIQSVDLLYLDGHHARVPTLRYYEMVKPFFSLSTIVVVDDIRWSAEMYSAWVKLCNRPEVKAAHDMYHFGVLQVMDNGREGAQRLHEYLWPLPRWAWMRRN